MAVYRLSREAMQDLPGTLESWLNFTAHMQTWGGNVSAVTIDGKRLTAGRIEITTSLTLTADQQSHLGVIPA
jgi:hypothetical protein